MVSKRPESNTVQQVQQVQQPVALSPVAGGATGLISIKPVAPRQRTPAKTSPRVAADRIPPAEAGTLPTGKPTFALTLQAVPGSDVPPIIRLRRFLKAALRSYGLRCVECREHASPCPMPPDGQSIDPAPVAGSPSPGRVNLQRGSRGGP
jgi:hypothetical protein